MAQNCVALMRQALNDAGFQGEAALNANYRAGHLRPRAEATHSQSETADSLRNIEGVAKQETPSTSDILVISFVGGLIPGALVGFAFGEWISTAVRALL